MSEGFQEGKHIDESALKNESQGKHTFFMIMFSSSLLAFDVKTKAL